MADLLIGVILISFAVGLIIGFLAGKADKNVTEVVTYDTRMPCSDRPMWNCLGEPIPTDRLPKHARTCDIIHGHAYSRPANFGGIPDVD